MTTTVLYKSTAIFALALVLSACADESAHIRQDTAFNGSLPARISQHPATVPAAPAIARTEPVPIDLYTHRYASGSVTGTYRYSTAVQAFIHHMTQTHGFDTAYLNGLFSRANRLYSVIRLETEQQPYTGPVRPGGWSRYRSKFLTDGHINNGVRFWLDNAGAIQKASAAYGVDPEYIVAIIGVETYFGRNVGKTSIFDALTTLAFDTQRRSAFFTSELENFLLMTREEGLDPLQPVGSWAGAMGLGQFMPSSFRNLAVDFDGDGKRDIWQCHDAIGSVAHYFSKRGWQLHALVAERAANVVDNDVIALSTYAGDEYWHVYPNFKVIKSYNNSDKYAMAVHQLAQAIKQRYY